MIDLNLAYTDNGTKAIHFAAQAGDLDAVRQLHKEYSQSLNTQDTSKSKCHRT